MANQLQLIGLDLRNDLLSKFIAATANLLMMMAAAAAAVVLFIITADHELLALAESLQCRVQMELLSSAIPLVDNNYHSSGSVPVHTAPELLCSVTTSK